MRRSTTYNIPHPRSATALPERKQNDRGQSPTKTMRTDSDRGVATKVPQQCSAHEDDSANAAYDICYNANDIDEEVPGTFDEAMRSPDATGWLEACKKEIDNLNAMACYELASIPPGHRVLKSKWVFKKKDMPDGTQIFKARVVIKGFAQREGLDYDETYAPVIRSDSLRMILAIITATGMKCRQGDATNAYIHAKNDRELYMTPPDGFEANGKSWRILGALYGLKQSAMLWYRHLKNILENFGFAATSSDSCVFIRQNEGRLQIVTVYVDDVLVCAATDDEINDIFTYLQRHIRLNDLGPVRKLLGMEIKRNEELFTTCVTQETYIQRMAIKYGLENSKRVDTPIPAGSNLTEDVGVPLDDNNLYRQIVGSILYCAMTTRPDVVHAITQLSRHLSSPHQLHLLMARRVVVYLLHTKQVGITFHG
ncbi:hypothetical protein LEN26_004562 [Aphanomyces euteiches]|nr:hypothetical protein LEN26_004562 [Aphanomyces euteiches]